MAGGLLVALIIGTGVAVIASAAVGALIGASRSGERRELKDGLKRLTLQEYKDMMGQYEHANGRFRRSLQRHLLNNSWCFARK